MDAILQTIHVTFLYSIPSTFIVMMFTLVFWGAEYKRVWKRALYFAILQPLIGNLTLGTLPPSLHLISFLAIYALLFFIFFSQFSKTQRLMKFIFSYVSLLLADVIASVISLLMPINFEERLDWSSAFYFLLYVWPMIIVYGMATFVMIRRKYSPGTNIIGFIQKRTRSPLMLVLLFLFIQFILAAIILGQIFGSGNFSGRPSFFTLLIFEVLTLVVFFIMLRTISVVKETTVNQTQEVYLSNIESMFTSIRGQRHDFLNHVQVLRAMIERNKLEDFMRYSKDLIGEIDEVNEIIHIGHPAISALIQSKVARSISEKVKFTYSFSGLSQLTSGVKTIDIVKIMANLLDNAFDEVSELPLDNRWVDIEGHVENGTLSISVKNPLRAATENELSVLFQSGFTTKDKSKHSGLGLSIIKENVERYKGKVNIEKTDGNHIVFRISLAI